MRQPRVCVELSTNTGLGGMLSNAARALDLGEQCGTQVSLRFTTPLYMPSTPVSDWLDSYFVRLGPGYTDAEPRVEAGDLPDIYRKMAIARAGQLVWSYMQVRPEIRSSTADYVQGTYAAVHFRGSDKYLEAKPVRPDVVLDCVGQEMRLRGIDRLFVASDEPQFMALARERFGGDRCFFLPQQAVAIAGRPPHFADIAGEIKALEAIQTMLVLASAQVCVRTASFLSAWSRTLAPAHHEHLLVEAGGIVRS